MSTTFTVSMGDRGRLVIPSQLRGDQQWEQGTSLLLVETSRGVLIMSQAQAKTAVRDQLKGTNLVEELLEERRLAARREDAA